MLKMIEDPAPSIDWRTILAAKFHPDPIWNDWGLGFFLEEQDEQRYEISSWSKMMGVTIINQTVIFSHLRAFRNIERQIAVVVLRC